MFDASFDNDTCSGATGAVIRDDTGDFIAASSCLIPFVQDATMAEARALRDGLLLAGQIGCTKIIVNSDCWDVISTMQDGGNSVGVCKARENTQYKNCLLFYFSA